MSQEQDFERAWLAKLSHCVEAVAGQAVREQVMEGSSPLSSASSRPEVIAWSQQAMERLEALVDEVGCRAIMTGCACQYPKADLAEIRARYAATGDADLAHQTLQARFEAFLREVLELDEALISQIVDRGWGLAGIKEGDTVYATKIPKSGNLVQYMQETDSQRRRQLYCHCPRIRDVLYAREGLRTPERLSPTYCYCGAGYYKGIWEEILQRAVEVEVLKSVLQGDEVCKIAIHM